MLIFSVISAVNFHKKESFKNVRINYIYYIKFSRRLIKYIFVNRNFSVAIILELYRPRSGLHGEAWMAQLLES